ncbi:hypothetical protein SAMN05660865_01096 [Caloramator fervidus]|uniref:MJ0042 family finger-like domain-containing protein n=1 Tax=Caloramator fervidus TaxID=29344 RepID=A0A1H5V3S7_9CLOT|nr:CD1247 N-terminal domain-containing protein [Caloramator fervidus]SEF81884.1 hypothetical protein SAMN05660865_01096 [Caloramator fervidus]
MNIVKERVSYLKGLADGLGINEDTKEGKLLIAIIDVLDEIAEEIDRIYGEQADLEEYVDAIDEDLTRLEDELYEDDDYEDDAFVEVECPHCNEKIFLDKEVFEDEEEEEIICPNCNEPIFIKEECECDSEDCNC